MPEVIIAPIIHLNGTSAEHLLNHLFDAYNGLQDAYERLKLCAPNGRDFYPEPGRMDKAEAQHRRRLQTVHDLMNELEREIELIQEQRDR